MKLSTFYFFIFLSISNIYAQQPSQQWLNRYNGKGDYSDKINCAIADNSGNIYLAGYIVNSGNKKDYLIAKLNSNGDTLWTKTYNGSGKKDDEVLAIACDASNNVFVTGYSKSTNNEDDIVTLKYDPNGLLLLTLIYNNISNQDDQGNSIALDASGNIYVTGKTDIDVSNNTNDDFITLKYDNSGSLIWSTLYNGNGNATDRAVKVVTDNSSNVYVTGRSNNGTDDDYYTIKYNSNGSINWQIALDKGLDDRPENMFIDGSFNLYITGKSDNGSDDDILTIKYASNGTELWTGGILYNGTGGNNDKAYGIVVDGSGNVYVAGKTDNDPSTTTNYDYCTLKYNSSGSQQWVKTYNGVGDLTDEASSIVLDNSGNIIVTGHSDINNNPLIDNFNIVTISYTPSGTQSWLQSYQGPSNFDENSTSVVLNGTSLIVVGYSENASRQKDALTLKYTTSGTLTWAKTIDGQGDNSDNVNDIFVESSGANTYLAGYTYNASTEKDMCVIKLNSVGDTLWTRTYNGTNNSTDEATAIKVDASGNVYITGFTKESTTDYDITTIKYNSSGTQQWITKYNNPSVNGEDQGVHLAIDNLGNVYVSGYSDGDASTILNEDFITIKYNSSGVQTWATRFNGTGNATDIPSGLGILQTGKVFITGKSDNGNDDDYVTICYNATGTQQWLQRYDGLNGNDKPSDLIIDNSNNVTVTGRKDNGNDDDIVTIQYAVNGVQNWINTYNSGIGNDRGIALAKNANGEIFITGTQNDGVQNDIVTFGINTSGTHTWINHFDGTNHLDDIPSAIEYDNNGFIIIAGQTGISATNSNFFIRKINNNGTLIWSQTYDGQINQNDGVNIMSLDGLNNVYVSGNSNSTNGQKDIVTIKYDSPLSFKEINDSNFSIRIFPNPFSESTRIEFNNSTNANYIVEIFNLTGKKLSSQKFNSSEIIIERNNLANGTYIFTLQKENDEIQKGKITVQ
jgi:uncharacterized delta-60 repeat protein